MILFAAASRRPDPRDARDAPAQDAGRSEPHREL